MESSINKAIHLALKKILSALCRILLRHSVSSGVFVELFKIIFLIFVLHFYFFETLITHFTLWNSFI